MSRIPVHCANIGVGQEWQDTIPEMVPQHPCYRQMKPRHPGLTSSLTYGEAQACFNKWMWYTMKLLGKWYKCQAERTKNKLRGEQERESWQNHDANSPLVVCRPYKVNNQGKSECTHTIVDRLYPCNVIASCETGINDGAFGTLSLSEAYYTRLTRLRVLYFMLIRELREDMM